MSSENKTNLKANHTESLSWKVSIAILLWKLTDLAIALLPMNKGMKNWHSIKSNLYLIFSFIYRTFMAEKVISSIGPEVKRQDKVI